MTSLQIAYLSPGSLHAHPRNAREHSDHQIEQIASSIQAFGFNSPVLVDGKRQILAGHGRVRAAIMLGLDDVPTVSIQHLSEGQRRAFMLADNRLTELSTWNEPILAAELEELSVIDEPFEITDTGFELPKIDVLIEGRHKPEPAADPADVPVDESSVDRVARLGDVWLLGRHQLFVGNALEQASYQALLGSRKADLIFIDPPFNVPISGHVSGLGKNQHREFVMASGEMSERQFEEFLRTAFQRLAERSVDGAIHFVCMDWRGLRTLLAAGDAYTEFKNLCCWVKAQGGMGSLYRSQHELVAVFKSGSGPHINNVNLGRHGRNRSNVWSIRYGFISVANAPPYLALSERPKPRMPGTVTRKAMIARDGYHCRFCGIPVIDPDIRRLLVKAYPAAVSWGSTNATQHAAFQCMWLQFDHILPNSRGGDSSLENMVVTCAPCNFGRMEATLEEARLINPLSSPVPVIWGHHAEWDGLERFRKELHAA